MKKYETIAFDLDGTLTNPERGLLCAFVYAFKRLGVEYGTRESLKRFIGPPLYDEWQREFGWSFEEASDAIEIFREYYNVYGWWDNEVYDGIKEMLSHLKASGKKLVVATSKPEITAKKVLHLFELDGYFDYIAGASMNGSADQKWQILERALDAVSADRSTSILVGDRKFDAEGAKICGIDSLGVLWGHGSREELYAADFISVVKTPDDALKFLI